MARRGGRCRDAARPWTGFYIGVGAGAGAAATATCRIITEPTMVLAVRAHSARSSPDYDRMLTSRIVGGIFADYDFASNVSTDSRFVPIWWLARAWRTRSRSARAWACCRARPPSGTARPAIRRPRSARVDFKGYFLGAGVESQLHRSVGTCSLEYRFSQFGSEVVSGGSIVIATARRRRARRAFGSRCVDLQVGSQRSLLHARAPMK